MSRIQLKFIEPLIIIGLLVGMVLVTVAPVSACSCMLSTPAEEFADVDAVFAAEVSDIEEDEDNEQLLVTLTVLHTWKGETYTEEEEIVVLTPNSEAACGYNFEADETYLVYARLQDEALAVNSCSNTALLLDALSQFAIIGTDDAMAPLDQPNSPLALPTSPLATPAATKSTPAATATSARNAPTATPTPRN